MVRRPTRYPCSGTRLTVPALQASQLLRWRRIRAGPAPRPPARETRPERDKRRTTRGTTSCFPMFPPSTINYEIRYHVDGAHVGAQSQPSGLSAVCRLPSAVCHQPFLCTCFRTVALCVRVLYRVLACSDQNW